MKNLPYFVLACVIPFAGCGKQEEPATVVADAVADPAVVEEAPAVVEESMPANLQDEVVAQVEDVIESVKESIPEISEAMPEVEDLMGSMPKAEDITSSMPDVGDISASMPDTSSMTASMPDTSGMTASMPSMETETPEVNSSSAGMLDQAMGAAVAAASTVDWTNLSWAKVAEIPYGDKDKLLAWVAPQVDSLKDKLTKAAMEKGTAGLTSLGDSGWQGAIKSTISAMDSAKNASPETWEMARGALVNAWEILQSEATKYLGAG